MTISTESDSGTPGRWCACSSAEHNSDNLWLYKLESSLLWDPTRGLNGTSGPARADTNLSSTSVMTSEALHPLKRPVLDLKFVISGSYWLVEIQGVTCQNGECLLNRGVTEMFKADALDVADRAIVWMGGAVVGVCRAVASRAADVWWAHVTGRAEPACRGPQTAHWWARGYGRSPEMSLVQRRSLPALHFWLSVCLNCALPFVNAGILQRFNICGS